MISRNARLGAVWILAVCALSSPASWATPPNKSGANGACPEGLSQQLTHVLDELDAARVVEELDTQDLQEEVSGAIPTHVIEEKTVPMEAPPVMDRAPTPSRRSSRDFDDEPDTVVDAEPLRESPAPKKPRVETNPFYKVAPEHKREIVNQPRTRTEPKGAKRPREAIRPISSADSPVQELKQELVTIFNDHRSNKLSPKARDLAIARIDELIRKVSVEKPQPSQLILEAKTLRKNLQDAHYVFLKAEKAAQEIQGSLSGIRQRLDAGHGTSEARLNDLRKLQRLLGEVEKDLKSVERSYGPTIANAKKALEELEALEKVHVEAKNSVVALRKQLRAIYANKAVKNSQVAQEIQAIDEALAQIAKAPQVAAAEIKLIESAQAMKQKIAEAHRKHVTRQTVETPPVEAPPARVTLPMGAPRGMPKPPPGRKVTAADVIPPSRPTQRFGTPENLRPPGENKAATTAAAELANAPRWRIQKSSPDASLVTTFHETDLSIQAIADEFTSETAGPGDIHFYGEGFGGKHHTRGEIYAPKTPGQPPGLEIRKPKDGKIPGAPPFDASKAALYADPTPITATRLARAKYGNNVVATLFTSGGERDVFFIHPPMPANYPHGARAWAIANNIETLKIIHPPKNAAELAATIEKMKRTWVEHHKETFWQPRILTHGKPLRSPLKPLTEDFWHGIEWAEPFKQTERTDLVQKQLVRYYASTCDRTCKHAIETEFTAMGLEHPDEVSIRHARELEAERIKYSSGMMVSGMNGIETSGNETMLNRWHKVDPDLGTSAKKLVDQYKAAVHDAGKDPLLLKGIQDELNEINEKLLKLGFPPAPDLIKEIQILKMTHPKWAPHFDDPHFIVYDKNDPNTRTEWNTKRVSKDVNGGGNQTSGARPGVDPSVPRQSETFDP